MYNIYIYIIVRFSYLTPLKDSVCGVFMHTKSKKHQPKGFLYIHIHLIHVDIISHFTHHSRSPFFPVVCPDTHLLSH